MSVAAKMSMCLSEYYVVKIEFKIDFQTFVE